MHQQSNQIQIRPGLETHNIKISTSSILTPLAINSVKFIPNTSSQAYDNDQIKYFSADKFTMTHMQQSINFSITADIDTPQGVYFIEWTIEQEQISQQFKQLYQPPTKTYVEIARNFKAEFTVSVIGQIEIDSTSSPIKISASHSPNDSVVINLKTDSPLITIFPSSLEFNSQTFSRFFEIKVNPNYQIPNNTYTLTEYIYFEISGPDQEAYKPLENKEFVVVESGTLSGRPKVLSVIYKETTRTSVEVHGECSSTGYMTYYIAADGIQHPTTEQMTALLYSFFNIDSVKPPSQEDQAVLEYKPSQEDMEDERLNSWIAFQRRMYKEHLEKVWWGAEVVESNVQTPLVKLEDLFAETGYTAWVYCFSASGKWSEPRSLYFKTADMPNAVNVQLTFYGEVTANYLRDLQMIVAYSMGISDQRLMNGSINASRRRLQSDTSVQKTVFSWDLPAMRNIESPTPEQEAKLTSRELEWQLQQIASLKIPYTSEFSFSPIDRLEYIPPKWRHFGYPQVTTRTQSTIYLQMQPSTLGECCCLPLLSPLHSPNAEQILSSLDEQNKPVKGQCRNYTHYSSILEIQLTGLTGGKTYQIYCMCYNNYPVWPISMDYTKEVGIAYITAETEPFSIPQEEPKPEDNWGKIITLCYLILVII